MNHASQWRIDISRAIAEVYRELPGVAMLAVGGSAAKGVADSYSDIDFAVYWEGDVDTSLLDPPPLESHGARRFTYHDTFGTGEVYLEQYFIGKLKIDVAHLSLPWWEKVVGEALATDPVNIDFHEVLDGFMTAVPLYNHERYEEWRARVGAYPDALARHIVGEHLGFIPVWILDAHGIARNDLFSYSTMTAAAITDIVAILAAINRVYLSTGKLKRIEELLSRMPIAPAGTARRINEILNAERHAAIPLLGALIDETIALVAERMPEVDLTKVRKRLTFTIEPCEERPPFGPSVAAPTEEAVS